MSDFLKSFIVHCAMHCIVTSWIWCIPLAAIVPGGMFQQFLHAFRRFSSKTEPQHIMLKRCGVQNLPLLSWSNSAWGCIKNFSWMQPMSGELSDHSSGFMSKNLPVDESHLIPGHWNKSFGDWSLLARGEQVLDCTAWLRREEEHQGDVVRPPLSIVLPCPRENRTLHFACC